MFSQSFCMHYPFALTSNYYSSSVSLSFFLPLNISLFLFLFHPFLPFLYHSGFFICTYVSPLQPLPLSPSLNIFLPFSLRNFFVQLYHSFFSFFLFIFTLSHRFRITLFRIKMIQQEEKSLSHFSTVLTEECI